MNAVAKGRGGNIVLEELVVFIVFMFCGTGVLWLYLLASKDIRREMVPQAIARQSS
jgi:hypothetical protein